MFQEHNYEFNHHPDTCGVIGIGESDFEVPMICFKEDHLSHVVSKANMSLGFLKGTLQIRSPDIKENAYFGLVRPQVEYASSVWDPYHTNQVHSIEMVQRRAARWVLNIYHNTSSVTDVLHHLGWQTLQQRRQYSRLVIFYKMFHGLVAVSPIPILNFHQPGHPSPPSVLLCTNPGEIPVMPILVCPPHHRPMECSTTDRRSSRYSSTHSGAAW